MRILNVGSLNIDYVYDVDHFVQPGETMASKGMFINCGGKGLNQSIAMAKAGNHVCHMAKLGRDGLMLKEKLEENGVDTAMIELVDTPSGHAIIQVDQNGQNCILLYGGTNRALTKEGIVAALDAFGTEGLVLLQNETNLVGFVIEEAAKRGLQVALNAAPMEPGVLDYPLDQLTWLMVNEVEGRQIAGCEKDEDILPILSEKYPHCNILLTLGSRGACCKRGNTIYQIGCHKTKVVDTTAAGDTFCGYFLYGMLNGISIPDTLRMATTASALCIGKQGASDSVPTKTEVEEAFVKGIFPVLPVTESTIDGK